jgi:hypothetical protein
MQIRFCLQDIRVMPRTGFGKNAGHDKNSGILSLTRETKCRQVIVARQEIAAKHRISHE